MGYFNILSGPRSSSAPQGYKGLYRLGPPLPEGATGEYLALWYRYVEYLSDDHSMGITTQLNLSELKKLKALSEEQSGAAYELIWFETAAQCPRQGAYYGMDVVGIGGYSLLGEGALVEKSDYPMLSRLRQLVCGKLNRYGLFSDEEDARAFCTALQRVNQIAPGLIEQEEWRVVHIFSL